MRVTFQVCQLLAAVLGLTGWAGASGETPPHPGAALYRQSCAACHDHPESTRAPALATLKGMRYQTIYYELTEGRMKAQAAALSTRERATLIDYLVGRQPVSDAWVASLKCPADRVRVDLDAAPTVADFGFEPTNQRRLTAEQAGLRTADFRHLTLAWALAFPGATTMRAQAAIVGTTLFLPVSDAAELLALDIAARPCLKWIYRS